MIEQLKPNVGILKAPGINCDKETLHAFTLAGANTRELHITDLISGQESLKNYQIVAVPGGFSFGDDIGAGTILALKFNKYLGDAVTDLVEGRGGLAIGICNGFQVFVKSGLLPFGTIGEQQATLTNNDSGHFDCRWIDLQTEPDNACVFMDGMTSAFPLQVAHGEGKFLAPPEVLERVEREKLVVFRYANPLGEANTRPYNPNGSMHDIAGICDPSGHILGLMPHPERFVRAIQHPNSRRMPGLEPAGLKIFEQMVTYVSQSR